MTARAVRRLDLEEHAAEYQRSPSPERSANSVVEESPPPLDDVSPVSPASPAIYCSQYRLDYFQSQGSPSLEKSSPVRRRRRRRSDEAAAKGRAAGTAPGRAAAAEAQAMSLHGKDSNQETTPAKHDPELPLARGKQNT